MDSKSLILSLLFFCASEYGIRTREELNVQWMFRSLELCERPNKDCERGEKVPRTFEQRAVECDRMGSTRDFSRGRAAAGIPSLRLQAWNHTDSKPFFILFGYDQGCLLPSVKRS